MGLRAEQRDDINGIEWAESESANAEEQSEGPEGHMRQTSYRDASTDNRCVTDERCTKGCALSPTDITNDADGHRCEVTDH